MKEWILGLLATPEMIGILLDMTGQSLFAKLLRWQVEHMGGCTVADSCSFVPALEGRDMMG
jgi:hypothetical protein